MTKSLHKLVLRKETVRALNTVDLARVVGGADFGIAQFAPPPTSGDVGCPLQLDIIVPGK